MALDVVGLSRLWKYFCSDRPLSRRISKLKQYLTAVKGIVYAKKENFHPLPTYFAMFFVFNSTLAVLQSNRGFEFYSVPMKRMDGS